MLIRLGADLSRIREEVIKLHASQRLCTAVMARLPGRRDSVESSIGQLIVQVGRDTGAASATRSLLGASPRRSP